MVGRADFWLGNASYSVVKDSRPCLNMTLEAIRGRLHRYIRYISTLEIVLVFTHVSKNLQEE